MSSSASAAASRPRLLGAPIPAGKTIIHLTNNEADVNKDVVADIAIVGDARLVLRQLIEEVQGDLFVVPASAGLPPEGGTTNVADEIAALEGRLAGPVAALAHLRRDAAESLPRDP